MTKAHKIDATKGPILINLIRYAMPIAIGTLVQSLFTSADMAVLGNFASSTAVASISATGVISGLIIYSTTGLAAGVQVAFAQVRGEQSPSKMQKTTSTAMILSLIIGVFVAILGFIVSKPLLILTDCPEQCLTDAVLYLQITFACAIPSVIYNFGMALIRANGDTQRPLYYMLTMGVLNVVLNLVLCLIMLNKVAAVAIATLVSQILGTFLVIRRLIMTDDDCKLTKNLIFDFIILKKILLIGIPQALTITMFPLSNLQIQSHINSFGPSAIAGNSSACNVENWVGAFTSAMHSALLTFMGQNIGAKNPERIRRSFFHGAWVGAAIGLVLGLGFFAFGRPILHIFLPDDAAAVEVGFLRMHFVLAMYALCSFKGTLSTSLQAFGYAVIPTINCFFSVIILRIIWMNFIYPHFLTIDNLFLCYLVSWIIETVISVILVTIIFKKKMKKTLAPTIEKAVI